jgi:hypothetical protein
MFKTTQNYTKLHRITQSHVTVIMYHLQRSVNVGIVDKPHA